MVPWKTVVNYISLKVGSKENKEHTLLLKKHGRVVLVMAFDEEDQAVTTAENVRIYKRSYDVRSISS